jgi:hypothetical protein
MLQGGSFPDKRGKNGPSPSSPTRPHVEAKTSKGRGISDAVLHIARCPKIPTPESVVPRRAASSRHVSSSRQQQPIVTGPSRHQHKRHPLARYTRPPTIRLRLQYTCLGTAPHRATVLQRACPVKTSRVPTSVCAFERCSPCNRRADMQKKKRAPRPGVSSGSVPEVLTSLFWQHRVLPLGPVPALWRSTRGSATRNGP